MHALEINNSVVPCQQVEVSGHESLVKSQGILALFFHHVVHGEGIN